MNPHKLESWGATVATGGAFGVELAEVDHWIRIVTAILTLGWWIRIWLKNPNTEQPPRNRDH